MMMPANRNATKRGSILRYGRRMANPRFLWTTRSLFIIEVGKQMIGEEQQGSEQQNSSIDVGHWPDNQPKHEGQAQLDDREVGKENSPCP